MNALMSNENPFVEGMPFIEHDGDGRHIMVMPAVDNPGKLMELISLRRRLADLADIVNYIPRITKILNGDDSGIANLSERSRETLLKAATAAKGAYQLELEGMPQDSQIVRAELASIRTVTESNVLVWFTGLFKPGAKTIGAMADANRMLKARSIQIFADIKRLNTEENNDAMRAGINERIAELKMGLPEDQHGLTELPLLRMPLDDVRALMAAKLAEKPVATGRKGSKRQKKNRGT
jgi:hypothetical protein